jgi:hypothetical protein
VDLYIHSPMCLQVIVLNQLSTGTPLPLVRCYFPEDTTYVVLFIHTVSKKYLNLMKIIRAVLEKNHYFFKLPCSVTGQSPRMDKLLYTKYE